MWAEEPIGTKSGFFNDLIGKSPPNLCECEIPGVQINFLIFQELPTGGSTLSVPDVMYKKWPFSRTQLKKGMSAGPDTTRLLNTQRRSG